MFMAAFSSIFSRKVRKGRKAEFAAFQAQGEAPDPQATESFERSKLQWNLSDREPHATMLRYYKALLALRKNEPALKPLRESLSVDADEEKKLLILRRADLICYLNFSTEAHTTLAECDLELVFHSSSPEWGGSDEMCGNVDKEAALHLSAESISIYRSNV
jgi:maltooligosyltrehalose trehalohydrolase